MSKSFNGESSGFIRKTSGEGDHFYTNEKCSEGRLEKGSRDAQKGHDHHCLGAPEEASWRR